MVGDMSPVPKAQTEQPKARQPLLPFFDAPLHGYREAAGGGLWECVIRLRGFCIRFRYL